MNSQDLTDMLSKPPGWPLQLQTPHPSEKKEEWFFICVHLAEDLRSQGTSEDFTEFHGIPNTILIATV